MNYRLMLGALLFSGCVAASQGGEFDVARQQMVAEIRAGTADTASSSGIRLAI